MNVSMQNIEISVQKYRYSKVSILYRPSLIVLYKNFPLNIVFKQPFERSFREVKIQLTSRLSKRSSRCLDRSCIEITLNIYSCSVIVRFHSINIIFLSHSYPTNIKEISGFIFHAFIICLINILYFYYNYV